MRRRSPAWSASARAGAAASRPQLRDRPAADGGPPYLPATRRSDRCRASRSSAINALFAGLAPHSLQEATEEGFSPVLPCDVHAPAGSALPAPGLSARRRLSGFVREAAGAISSAAFDCAASAALWPVRAERGRRNRFLPSAGGDRGAAARIAGPPRRRRRFAARAFGRAPALRHRLGSSSSAREHLRPRPLGPAIVSRARPSSTSSTPPRSCSPGSRCASIPPARW